MPQFIRVSKAVALRFASIEASSSLVLAAATIIALVLANGPLATFYFESLHCSLLGLSVHHWINDGLMTIFFFVVGLEIKREIVAGQLSSFRQAIFPVAAAIGGMLMPALIYRLFVGNGPGAEGWAIPMATDIAFALGILTLFGKRVPLALKMFLLALAIVDDLAAVAVIAIFYTEEIRTLGFVISAAGIVAILLLRDPSSLSAPI